MIRTFSEFLNESEAGGVDTSSNPLWNQISAGLAGIGKPKRINFMDDTRRVASLNWGLEQRTGSSTGLAVKSSDSLIEVFVKSPDEKDLVVTALKAKGLKAVPGATGGIVTADYSGSESAKVVEVVKGLLTQLGLA